MNMERILYNKVEVEKLIMEKNVVGLKKFCLEGIRIFFLVLILIMFLSVILIYFYFLLKYGIFVNIGYVRSVLEEWFLL